MNRFILAVMLALTMLLTAACSRAPSNVRVLNTSDCGKSWEVISTGSRIPTNTGNWCGYHITLPDYPMQGGAEFLTQFQNNVLVKTQISYDYQITDPLAFINNAKFLGRMRSETTGEDAQGGGQYEAAENVVIDIRLRELVTNMTKDFDIVQFNPSKFEDELFAKANIELGKRGVTLNSMTFVTLPEDQTRMAIDAATAMKGRSSSRALRPTRANFSPTTEPMDPPMNPRCPGNAGVAPLRTTSHRSPPCFSHHAKL